MLTIDGSYGEGGGQILRSSLALSMETGQPFCITDIRAGRKKPGLLRQHLTAVQAATKVCNAQVQGAEMRSQTLTFRPGRVQGGEYTFAVGTAGSATLVLQTVLPALMTADEPSTITLRGGTHNPWAPPFDFLNRTLLPLLSRMGPSVKAKLIRPGFFPSGGGEFVVTVEPANKLLPLEIMERGKIVSRQARAIVANLSPGIAQRELAVVQQKLGWDGTCLHVEETGDSIGPGNVLLLEVESESITEVFTGFGQVDVPAKSVANHAVQKLQKYLAANVPVGEYLADQLLVPMALAGGKYRTVGPTRHTRTNIDLIQRFLNIDINVTQIDKKTWEIGVI